jgi:SAM-dependent methyltransferase
MFLTRQIGHSPERLQGLRAWCEGGLGKRLVEVEQKELAEELNRIFGFHLVLVDPCCSMDSLRVSRIRHHVCQSCSPGMQHIPVSLLARNDQMPWQTDSIDAFILPHVLEHAENPHQTLRELDRCLVADGHLIFLGFNPWGLWGWRRLFSWRSESVPWNLRFISLARLKDWLSLLGYDIVVSRYYFTRLPWSHTAWTGHEGMPDGTQRTRWPFLAACYLLVARKRVVTLTPIKPRWRPRRSLVAGGVIEPTQRGFSGNG